MINTEYIRSLNANYERMALGEKPEEKRYQYCMISRGGIKGLLPCSLRYIDGNAYLYYDITSRQNIAQLFDKKVINRQWLTDFLWSMRRVRQEMSRFYWRRAISYGFRIISIRIWKRMISISYTFLIAGRRPVFMNYWNT